MMMGINSPLPSSMEAECSKCGKILASFIDPSQLFGPDKFIPPQVLANAKGLAILTVFKAGFLGSARYGNGVVVARLSDRSWSAPSAVGTGGAGIGGQIGFELTDFVFILNDSAAVRTFSQVGTLTLGGNVSVAAGPVGRNAEAAGAANLKGVAGIFSYSKTRGFFAGVSVEGSAIVERRDANEKLYGRRVTANQLLTGSIPPPPAAQPLLNILNMKVFAGVESSTLTQYNLSPILNDRDTHKSSRGKKRSVLRDKLGKLRVNRSIQRGFDSKDTSRDVGTHADAFYHHSTDIAPTSSFGTTACGDFDDYVYSDTPHLSSSSAKNLPAKPLLPKLSKNQAIAMFTFEADRPGDLGFKKGDIITVTKSSDTKNDWWTGNIGNRTGIFPANYVEMRN